MEDEFLRRINFKGNEMDISLSDLSSEDQKKNEKEIPLEAVVNKKERNDAQILKDTVEKLENLSEEELAKRRGKLNKGISFIMPPSSPTSRIVAQAPPAAATGTFVLQKSLGPILAGLILGLLVFTVLYLFYS